MGFSLPLPKIIPDVGPGGQAVTAMRGANALLNDIYGTQKAGVEAEYAPLTVPAQALSQLAYANFLQPQYLAKLMGNPDILAQFADDPKKFNEMMRIVYGAGTGQTTGNSLVEKFFQNKENKNGSFFGNFVNNIRNGLFGSSENVGPTAQAPAYMGGGMVPLSNFGVNNALLGNQQNFSQPSQPMINGNQPNQVNTSVMEQPTPSQAYSTNQMTPAEKSGTYAGIKAEGEEAGKIRAQDVKDLSDIVFNGNTKQETLDQMIDIISSPAFEEVRQTPVLGDKELAYFQRYGTPEQQDLVGQFITLSGDIVKSSARDFAGQFRTGEQKLLTNMKVNPSDTFNAMRGKMKQLSYLNKMITERAKLTAKYMSPPNHMSKLEAQDLADKEVNGTAIREQIHNTLNPKPTKEDIDFMSQKYNVTPDEIRKRLKAKGIL